MPPQDRQSEFARVAIAGRESDCGERPARLGCRLFQAGDRRIESDDLEAQSRKVRMTVSK